MRRCWTISLLLLAACGEDTVAEPQAGEAAAAAATPVAEGGNVAPPYPGATPVEMPGTAPGEPGAGSLRVSETDDSPAKVASFYRERFAAAGMPLRANTAGPDGGILSVGAGDGLDAQVTIIRTPTRTRIIVIEGP